jgi:hypothetical protein
MSDWDRETKIIELEDEIVVEPKPAISDEAAQKPPPLCDGSSYQWYDGVEPTQGDPWSDWLQFLPSRTLLGRGPLEYPIEADIEDAIRGTDQLRLSIVPTTKHFAEMWTTFRRHHETLDDIYEYRRKRYLIWRAAALKEMCDRNRFQDDADRRQACDKLAATMREFGSYNANGSVTGYNCKFWDPQLVDFRTSRKCVVRPSADDGREPSPLEEYASMVLLLMKQSMCQRFGKVI